MKSQLAFLLNDTEKPQLLVPLLMKSFLNWVKKTAAPKKIILHG